MLAEMEWAQLMEWVAYAELEPFGEERSDWRSGMIASVIANVNKDPKRGHPFKPGDFMPKFGSEAHAKREPLMSGSQWSEVKRMARIYGSVKEN